MFGLLMFFAFTSCGDDDKYSAGEPTDAASPQAYFEAASEDGVVEPGVTHDYTCTVKRSNTSSAVTVPITASGDTELFTYPEAVTFAEGQESATFTVKFKGSEEEKSVSIVFLIDEDCTGIYSSGSIEYTLSVDVSSKWKIYDATLSFVDSYDATIVPFASQSVKVRLNEEDRMITINNFLNSGYPLTFTYDEYGDITFDYNCVWYDNSNYAYFCYYGEDGWSVFPTLYPDGKTEISYMDFCPNYWFDSYSYNFVNFADKKITFMYSYFIWPNDDWEYITMELTW